MRATSPRPAPPKSTTRACWIGRSSARARAWRVGPALCGGLAAAWAAGTLLAVEANHNDGPWVRPDDFRKTNAVVRFSRGDERNGLSVTAMGYAALERDRSGAGSRPGRGPHSTIRRARRHGRRPDRTLQPLDELAALIAGARAHGPMPTCCGTDSICSRTSPTFSTTRSTATSSSRPTGAGSWARGLPIDGASAWGNGRRRSRSGC